MKLPCPACPISTFRWNTAVFKGHETAIRNPFASCPTCPCFSLKYQRFFNSDTVDTVEIKKLPARRLLVVLPRHLGKAEPIVTMPHRRDARSSSSNPIVRRFCYDGYIHTVVSFGFVDTTANRPQIVCCCPTKKGSVPALCNHHLHPLQPHQMPL